MRFFAILFSHAINKAAVVTSDNSGQWLADGAWCSDGDDRSDEDLILSQNFISILRMDRKGLEEKRFCIRFLVP